MSLASAALKELKKFQRVDKQMIWHKSAAELVERFIAFAEAVEGDVSVVGSHTSKSLTLPVIQVKTPSLTVLVRDNFYDVNVCVRGYAPFALLVSELFDGVLETQDWVWYQGAMASARQHTWVNWTDTAMDDPSLLQVAFKTGDQVFKCEVTAEQKARWLARLTSAEWYGEDWARDVILHDGALGPASRLFIQPFPQAEGISALVPAEALQPYHPGCTGFSLALIGRSALDRAKVIMERLDTPRDIVSARECAVRVDQEEA